MSASLWRVMSWSRTASSSSEVRASSETISTTWFGHGDQSTSLFHARRACFSTGSERSSRTFVGRAAMSDPASRRSVVSTLPVPSGGTISALGIPAASSTRSGIAARMSRCSSRWRSSCSVKNGWPGITGSAYARKIDRLPAHLTLRRPRQESGVVPETLGCVRRSAPSCRASRTQRRFDCRLTRRSAARRGSTASPSGGLCALGWVRSCF
jgi:hypothetical protein